MFFPHPGSQLSGRLGSSAVPGGGEGTAVLGGRSFKLSLYPELSGSCPALSGLPLVHVGPPTRLSSFKSRQEVAISIGCQHTQVGTSTAFVPECGRPPHHPTSRPPCISLGPSASLMLHPQKTFLFPLRKQGCEGKWEQGLGVGGGSAHNQKLNPIRAPHAQFWAI